MNVVNIAPDGDVDFVVGTVKLRISSYILWGVSPVFRQMISNMYLEGARPSSTNPRSIFLPDNEKNMRILCMILHHQSDQVPEELDPRALLSFAKLLDKYKCASSAEIATRGWFRRALDKTSGIELIPLVEASWILDKADWFQDVTTKYVRTVDTKHEMPPWKQTTIMAVTTFNKLDRQASDIRAFVTTTIEKQILDSTSENSIYHAHDLSCIATAQALGESLKHAIVHGLWPLHELPGDLETCIARVERTPDREYSFGPCRSTHCDVNDSNFYWMRHRVKDARKKIVGLCLDCERYNGLPQGIPCRVNHD